MPGITVDLPWPPSQNSIWRGAGRHVYRSQKYLAWIEEAGWLIKAAKLRKVKGHFSATILLNPPDKRKIDLDNRIKAIFDLAQNCGLIENDHLCRRLEVSYGEAPLGARLTLTAISSD